MNTRGFFVSALLLLVTISAFAAGPNMLSYQGQVLTSGGTPVANATYPASFVFFSVPTGGLPLWSEPTTITTSAGLFTHTLGSITTIPAGFFSTNSSVWLEVTVNGQVQSPRTQLLSTGNAMAVSTVDGATGGTIRSSIGVGDPSVSSGSVAVYSTAAPFATGAFYDQAGYGAGIQLWDETGNLTGVMEPDFDGTGGFLATVNGFGSTAFAVDGNYVGSGSPYIYMGGLSSVSFNLAAIANNSVQLPDSAISAAEILDEPGVASLNTIASMTLTTTMQDLATVTITIPSAGYIWLSGNIGLIQLCGTTGINGGSIQIDETAGGTWSSAGMSAFGASNFPTTACFYESVSSQRMYFKASSGSYTFRLEGMNWGGTGTANAFYSRLTAIYLPTAYGSVIAPVSSAEASEFGSATLVKASGTVPANTMSAAPADVYMVDLRELELKVAKSRAETERLARELAEARLKEQMNVKPISADEKK